MPDTKTGLRAITKYLSSKKENERKRIGLLVDGPNVIRKEFNVDLYEIKNVLKEYGNLKVGKVFINQYASNKLIEAIENHGLEPIVCSTDVDVRLAVEGMELVYNPNIDTIAIVTRDADFKPLLNKANEKGKETIIFGIQPGFSIALRNSADYVILLKDAEMTYEEENESFILDIEEDKNQEEDPEVPVSRRIEVIKSKNEDILPVQDEMS
ncbi:MAG: TIGR00288 family NYN domain-containing protein [Methanimicrococcus sp.]|nr:TIGR00288 family NYN domain-containing protein [Methanimicrococcus sp.]